MPDFVSENARALPSRLPVARKVATGLAFLAAFLTVLNFFAWSQNIFSGLGWSAWMLAIDVEWAFILAGPVVGFLAGAVGLALAVRTRNGLAAATTALGINILLGL